jgi:hypothetical protein
MFTNPPRDGRRNARRDWMEPRGRALSGKWPRLGAGLGLALLLGLLLVCGQEGAARGQLIKGAPGIPVQEQYRAAEASTGVGTVPWPGQYKRRQASAEQIAQWLKELGAKRFQVRELAATALVEVGPPALEGLKKASHTADLEVRRRAESLITRIEQATALAPTVIELALRDTPVPEAVAAIARQSRLKLELIPQQGPAREQLEKKKIDLELEGVPLWEALDRLCEVAGLDYALLTPTTIQLQLMEGGPPRRVPTAVCGPFRLRIRALNYFRSLGLGSETPNAVAPGQPGVMAPALGSTRLLRQESLTATLDVLAEPHLPVLNLGNPTITEAKDQNDQSLLAEWTTSTGYTAHYPGGMIVPMQLRQTQFSLKPASRPAATLKVLKGTVPLEVQVQRTPLITVDDIFAKKSRIYKGEGDLLFVLLQVQDHGNNGRNGTIRFFLTGLERPDGGNAMNPNFGNPHVNAQLYQSQFELTDAQGQLFNLNLNFNHYPQPNDGTLEGQLYFSQPSPNMGPAVRLTFNRRKTIQTSVPFELRNVPMP